jgi:hypothetical protein
MTRQILAQLTFDSFTTSPAFGVRSGPSVARQVLYAAGEIDLDLRLAPDDGRWLISGQILGDCAAGEVELTGCTEAEAVRAPLDELCEFTLPPVPPGGYGLLVRFGDVEVEVPLFNLRG